jgi:hypothetical protein
MIDYAQQKWSEIKKVKDFLAFCEDPKINLMDFMETLIDIEKSSFWIAGNIAFDLDIDSAIESKPQIHHNEISTTTRTISEIEHHKKYNFGNGYNRHNPNEEIKKIVSALGFEEGSSSYLNNQPPGAVMSRHVDSVSCYTYEKKDSQKTFHEKEYDKIRRQPKGQKEIYRCMVALDDWHPGQLFCLEPNFWTNWKKGDIMFFDWRNTPHCTANCGVHNRPLLKITGTLSDDTWVARAKDTGEIKQFQL